MVGARAVVAVVAIALCACGSTTRTAALPTPTKPIFSPTAEPSSPPWVEPFEAIHFIDRLHGWQVLLASTGSVTVQSTSDGGVTWGGGAYVTAYSAATDGKIPHFGVRFANARDGWVFGQGLYASTDGGVVWTYAPIGTTVYDVGVVGNSVWALTDKGLFSTQAGGLNWAAMPAPSLNGDGPFALIRATAQIAFIAQQAQFETRLYRTVDGGANWKQIAVPCRGYAMPVATVDGVHLWMVCGSEPGAGEQGKWTYTSDDSGANWTMRSFNDGVKSSGSVPIIGYAKLLALTSATSGVMANDRGDVYLSTDHGRTWKATGLAYASEGFFNGLQFIDSQNGWFAGLIEGLTPDGSIGLYRTSDGGATWKMVDSMVGAAV